MEERIVVVVDGIDVSVGFEEILDCGNVTIERKLPNRLKMKNTDSGCMFSDLLCLPSDCPFCTATDKCIISLDHLVFVIR